MSPEPSESPSAASAAPVASKTLIDALRWHVERSSDRTHIWLGHEDGGEEAITYRALWERAVAVWPAR